MAQTPIKYGSLQIDERPFFQRITWWVERVGWGVFGLLIVAALLGLFGSGPLGTTTAAGPGFTVEYERVARQGSPSRIVVRFDPGAAGEDQAQIWISQDFVRSIRVEHVSPEPETASSSGEWTVYSVAVQSLGSNTFTLDFVHAARGSIPLRIGLSPGQMVDVQEFVFP